MLLLIAERARDEGAGRGILKQGCGRLSSPGTLQLTVNSLESDRHGVGSQHESGGTELQPDQSISPFEDKKHRLERLLAKQLLSTDQKASILKHEV